jgi:hypothetical protein
MEPATNPAHAASFRSRVLDPLASILNREAAESVLAVGIDLEIRARVQALAERANEGELAPRNGTNT